MLEKLAVKEWHRILSERFDYRKLPTLANQMHSWAGRRVRLVKLARSWKDLINWIAMIVCCATMTAKIKTWKTLLRWKCRSEATLTRSTRQL